LRRNRTKTLISTSVRSSPRAATGASPPRSTTIAWKRLRERGVLLDNAHDAEEHHEHRYVGAEKQPPTVTHGPVNGAIHAVELKLLRDWRDIVHEWEGTR
jgi:hypothetical protein